MRGFTLIELLVVIAILAVLAVAVVIVLNPAELIKEGRDSTRLSDLTTLNNAIAVYLADVLNGPAWSYGVFSTADCTPGSCNTPDLITTSSAVDGTGWVGINFKLISSGSPLPRLPVDPNNGGYCLGGKYSPDDGSIDGTHYSGYYLILAPSTYKFETRMESAKFYSNTATQVVTKDSGIYQNVYEVGNNLSMSD